MRSFSFLLAIFVIVGHLLPLTLASPLASDIAMHQNKRWCELVQCRVEEEPEESAALVEPLSPATQTVPIQSTPTPQPSADSGQDSGSVSPATSDSHLSSANAGVAFASRGTALCMALTGLLATVLAL